MRIFLHYYFIDCEVEDSLNEHEQAIGDEKTDFPAPPEIVHHETEGKESNNADLVSEGQPESDTIFMVASCVEVVIEDQKRNKVIRTPKARKQKSHEQHQKARLTEPASGRDKEEEHSQDHVVDEGVPLWILGGLAQ